MKWNELKIPYERQLLVNYNNKKLSTVIARTTTKAFFIKKIASKLALPTFLRHFVYDEIKRRVNCLVRNV